MEHLPREVGQPQDERNCSGEPEPAIQQDVASPEDDEGRRHDDRQREDERFVLERDPDDEPEGQPPAVPGFGREVVVEQVDQEPQRGGPEQDVERRGDAKVAGRDPPGDREDQGGEHLPDPAGSQPARHVRGQQDDHGRLDGGEHANGERRQAEDRD